MKTYYLDQHNNSVMYLALWWGNLGVSDYWISSYSCGDYSYEPFFYWLVAVPGGQNVHLPKNWFICLDKINV